MSLMDLMRMKKDTKKKNTPVRKKVKKQETCKNTTGNIERYLVKRKEDNNEKLTFSSTLGKQNITVREKIQKAQDL